MKIEIPVESIVGWAKDHAALVWSGGFVFGSWFAIHMIGGEGWTPLNVWYGVTSGMSLVVAVIMFCVWMDF